MYVWKVELYRYETLAVNKTIKRYIIGIRNILWRKDGNYRLD